MTRPEMLVSGMGVGTTLLSSLVKKAKVRGLKAEYVHLLVTEDERADALIDQMAEKMVAVLEQALLWSDVRLVWQRFYKDVFEMDVDFSGTPIPAGFDSAKRWLVGIPKGLDYARLQGVICRWESRRRNRPEPYFYRDLSEISSGYKQRLPKESYFIVAGNHVNAIDGDSQLAGKSNQSIHDESLPAQNAMERLVMDIFVDWVVSQNGGVQLLDQKGWTRTSSRWVGGRVVCVRRGGGGQLLVNWGSPDGTSPGSRARAASSV